MFLHLMKTKIKKTLCKMKMLIKKYVISTIRPLKIRICSTKLNQRSIAWYQDSRRRKRRFFQTLKMPTSHMWPMKTSKACQSGAKAPPLNQNRSHRIRMGKKVKLSPSKRLMGLNLIFSTQRKRSRFPCPVRPPLQKAKWIQMSQMPPGMSIT